MRTIDQILDDDKNGPIYTDGNAMWYEDDVKRLMKEYAIEVLDQVLYHGSEYMYSENNQVWIDWDKVEQLKQQINEQV